MASYHDRWRLPLLRWRQWWWSSAGWDLGSVPSCGRSVYRWRPSAPLHSETCPAHTHTEKISCQMLSLEVSESVYVFVWYQCDWPVSAVVCLDPVLPPPLLSGPYRWWFQYICPPPPTVCTQTHTHKKILTQFYSLGGFVLIMRRVKKWIKKCKSCTE